MKKISPLFRRAMSHVFSNPATSKYPFIKPQLSDNYRGQMQLNMRLCIGCGLCKRDCPAGGIEMVDFHNRKKRPQFSLGKCLFCYQCADSCPKKAITTTAFYELATTDKASLVMKPKHVIVCQE